MNLKMINQPMQSFSRIYPNSLDDFSLNGRLRLNQSTGFSR